MTPSSEPREAVRAGSDPGAEVDPNDWFSRVIGVVEAIPAGSVMTYGGVAAALGSKSSRGVGKVMAHAGGELPWWRVVRASGHPAEGHEQRALEMYRVEGTPLSWSRAGTWKVDLRRAVWAG